MFHLGKVPAIGLSLAVATLSAFFGAVASAPPLPPSVPVSTAVAHPSQPDCRASNRAGDVKALDVKALDVKALDVKALDVKALDVKALDAESCDAKACDDTCIDAEIQR